MADSIYLHGDVLYCLQVHQVLASQVQKMTVFVSVWHGSNFLKCGLVSPAPANGLEYFYYMLELSEVTAECSVCV